MSERPGQVQLAFRGSAGAADCGVNVAARQARASVSRVNAPDPAVRAGQAADGRMARDPPGQALRQLTEEQSALRRVATLVAQATPPEEVFAAVAEEVGQLIRVDVAMIRPVRAPTEVSVATWGTAGSRVSVGSRWPLEGYNVSTLVFETGRPARIDRYDN